jgi:lantibiotic leader peptide-processing serine protease
MISRRKTVSLLAIAALALGLIGAAGAPPNRAPSTDTAEEERYLVVFRGNGVPNNAETIVSDAGGSLVSTLPSVGLGFATSADPGFADALRGNNRIAEVDVEPRYSLPETVTSQTVTTETDPTEAAFWDLQWNIRRVHAPEAWHTTTGSHDTVVAVIDTGVAWNHPDLAANVVYTACFSTPEWECSEYPDLHWHGTHVAGTVAATGAVGVAGVGPDLGIASYNVFELMEVDEGVFGVRASFESIASAMLDAADQGFDVINMSLGASIDMADGRDSAATWTAVQRVGEQVQRHGVTTIVSAGNAAFSLNGSVKSVPGGAAANTNVAATGIRPDPEYPQEGAFDVLAFYSNFGASVEIAAPGGDCGLPDSCDPATRPPNFLGYTILSSFVDLFVTHPDEIPPCVETEDCPVTWGFAIGTSMAAPHVAGVAGLVRDQYPHLNANQVAERLTRTAEPLGDRQLFGHGMVDAQAAVTR